MIGDPVGVAAVIAAIVALAFWLEGRFEAASKAGAAILAISFGALLSNLGLLPASSPIYDGLFGPVTSLAIVWLLLAVRIGDLRDAGPRMLGAFGIAVSATALGAAVATLLFGDAFGGSGWKLAGVMTGTYSGGSLNFVAVGRELDLPPSLFSAAAAADNVVTAVWMGVTLVLPVYLGRFFVEPEPGRVEPEPGQKDSGPDDARDGDRRPFSRLFGETPLRLLDVAVLLAIGLVVLRLSEILGAAVPVIPQVLWLTTVALLVAQLPFVRGLSGAMPLGYLALHLFFVVIGIGSRFAEILAVGPEVLYLTVTIVAIHGLVVYGGAWLVRIDIGTASVASQAAVGGPSTALGLAMARGWPALALPGVAIGLLGYAAGTYAGFGMAYLVRGLLGS